MIKGNIKADFVIFKEKMRVLKLITPAENFKELIIVYIFWVCGSKYVGVINNYIPSKTKAMIKYKHYI